MCSIPSTIQKTNELHTVIEFYRKKIRKKKEKISLCPHFASIAVINTMTKRKVREGRIYSAYVFQFHSIIKENQDRSSTWEPGDRS